MSTIVTRAGKGSALTHNEVDANFINLNTDKVEADQTVTLTNKTISGSSNTLTNIGNASLTNSSVTIGSTSVSLGSTATTVSGLTLSSPTVSGGTINNASVGATTPSTGAFTSLSASSTVSGTGFSDYLASPPAIGGTAPAAITGTTITANTSFSGALNGSVGATTPNTGAFTTLSATGVTTVQAGSASAPAITTSGDTNTGVFFPAADTVAISTGGSEKVRVDSAGNAGLGITPSAWKSNAYAMQLGNRASLRGADNLTTIANNYYDNGTNAIYLASAAASDYYQSAGSHVWRTASSGTAGNPITFTQAMTLDASGNLGLGVTPSVWGSSYKAIQIPTGQFASTPAGAAVSYNLYFDGSNYRYIANGSAGMMAQGGDFRWYIAPSGTAGNAITFTQAMTLDASGNLGVGQTLPSYRLDVYDSGTTAAIKDVMRLYLDAGSTASVGMAFHTGANDVTSAIRNVTVATNAAALTFLTNNGTSLAERLRITEGGTLTSKPTYDNTASGSTVVVTSAGLIRRTSSSIKYKKDVEDLDTALATNAIDNLRPVWYRTKNAEGDDKATWSHVGLIAEEVHEVEPRLVRYRTVKVEQVEVPVLDDEGNPVLNEDNTPQVRFERVETELETPEPEDVDYGRLSVLLLAEIKSLKSRIAELENK